MLRGMAVVATTALVAALSVPALAQETLQGLQAVVDFVSEQSETDLEVRLDAAPSGGAIVTERAGDFEHLTGEPPRFTPNYMDLRQGAFFELQPGPAEILGRTTGSTLWSGSGPKEIDPRNGPAFFTYTGHLPKDGSQYQDGALLFEMTLREPPPPEPGGTCDFTVWINDAARETQFQSLPSFPLDPATGTNFAFGLRLAPPAGGVPVTFSLALDETGVFQRADTDVRAYLLDDTVGLVVPKRAVAGLVAVNYSTVCRTGSSPVDPATSGTDQTGVAPASVGEAGVVSIVETPVTAAPTAPETTTTTTTAPLVAPSVTEVAPEPEQGGMAWAPAVAAAALLGSVAYWAIARRRNPEERALAGWRKAERALGKVEEEADPLIAACLEAGAALEELEHDRADLCRVWPPACLDDEAGDEESTTRDQHFRRMALGELWADYQEGKIGVDEVETRWREYDTPEFRERMRESDEAYGETLAQLDEEIAAARATMEPACAQGAAAAAQVEAAEARVSAARDAYLETVEIPPDAPIPSAPWLIDECKQRAPRVSPDGPVERVRVNVGFMLTIARFAGKERNLEQGERLVLEMEGMLHELGLSETVKDMRVAGVHSNWSGHEYETGVYWVTQQGLVHQDSADVSPLEGEAQAEAPVPDPMPILSHLPASIGDHATSRIAGWMTGFETATMQRTFFHQMITSRPYTVWDCKDGVWTCRERVWRVGIGEPLRTRGEIRWFSTGSPGRRVQFETEVNRLAWVATGLVTRDLRRLARWRAKHVATPCP